MGTKSQVFPVSNFQNLHWRVYKQNWLQMDVFLSFSSFKPPSKLENWKIENWNWDCEQNWLQTDGNKKPSFFPVSSHHQITLYFMQTMTNVESTFLQSGNWCKKLFIIAFSEIDTNYAFSRVSWQITFPNCIDWTWIFHIIQDKLSPWRDKIISI